MRPCNNLLPCIFSKTYSINFIET